MGFVFGDVVRLTLDEVDLLPFLATESVIPDRYDEGHGPAVDANEEDPDDRDR